jgi:hypothetical protein
VVLTIAFLNVTSFIVVAVLIGGDAANGKSLSGHYYLWDHSGYHEVSKRLFTYSLWHSRSIMVTQPLAFVAALFYTCVSRVSAGGQSG